MTSTTSTRTEDFTAVRNLPAGPAAVSALFTSAAGVRRWGPTEGDGAVGGTLVTSFGEHGANTMHVLEAGPTRVLWEAIASDGTTPTGHTQEWLRTTIEFDIVPGGTGTELRFRHAGLTRQLECWDDCFAGWTHFMASIETFAAPRPAHRAACGPDRGEPSHSPSRRSASTSACSSRPASSPSVAREPAASTRYTTRHSSRCANCSPSSGPTPSAA